MGTARKMVICSRRLDWSYQRVVIGVDPGRDTGVAMLTEKGLVLAAAIPDTRYSDALNVRILQPKAQYTSLVWECPQVYPGQKKSNPASLITTAFRAGLVVGALRADNMEGVAPSVWKGQVPKAIQNDRTLKALAADEREMLLDAGFSAKQWDDVLDAVGIAVWFFGQGH